MSSINDSASPSPPARVANSPFRAFFTQLRLRLREQHQRQVEQQLAARSGDAISPPRYKLTIHFLPLLVAVFLFLFTLPLLIVAFNYGVGGGFLLTTGLLYSPTFNTTDGHLYTATHGTGYFTLFGYYDRVWLVNTSLITGEVLYTHYATQSALSSDCHYTVFPVVLGFSDKPSDRIVRDYVIDADEEQTLTAPACPSFQAVRAFFILLVLTDCIALPTAIAALTSVSRALSAHRMRAASADDLNATRTRQRLLPLLCTTVWATGIALGAVVSLVELLRDGGWDGSEPHALWYMVIIDAALLCAIMIGTTLACWRGLRELDSGKSLIDGLPPSIEYYY